MKSLKSICLFFIFFPIISKAQFDYTRKIEGMSIRVGASKSINESNIAPQSSNLAFCVSLYHRHNLNPKNSSLIPFHYLITEFNFGGRQGSTPVNSLKEMAKVENNYVEIALIAPLTWELSNKVALNAGLGGSLLYVTDQTIRPIVVLSESPRKYNSVKATIIADFHALILVGTLSNMLVGCRAIIEPSQYSFAEFGVYVGFSLPTFTIKKKKEVKDN
ncbi:MAG: hypothetical protein ACKO1F_06025 [Flammeovirgaceae bacterium]